MSSLVCGGGEVLTERVDGVLLGDPEGVFSKGVVVWLVSTTSKLDRRDDDLAITWTGSGGWPLVVL